jgi:signal transduction histidine kinase
VSEPRHMIHVDREMFRQALFNLIGNAIQFSPAQGVVEISIEIGQHGRGRIEIADRGPGVPAAAADQLFSPYFTTRPDGTGLGLAIVRRIATAHNWEVGHEPRPGGGSIFWLNEIHG